MIDESQSRLEWLTYCGWDVCKINYKIIIMLTLILKGVRKSNCKASIIILTNTTNIILQLCTQTILYEGTK